MMPLMVEQMADEQDEGIGAGISRIVDAMERAIKPCAAQAGRAAEAAMGWSRPMAVVG
jgi:hypothetical protein|tara:strand:+ start:350 stop:523 length:174 start_codon:yes stop_codon:yes gene_type:complete